MFDCFTKLSVTSAITKDLLHICNDSTAWIDPAVGTFFQKRPEKDLIYKDSFLQYICENYLLYDFRISVNIFMLRPWSHYMLHTDKFRSSSINMLINDDTDSISYFQVSDTYKLQYDILELKYDSGHYYLFNSQIPHAITNKASARYLLSISLKHDYITMKEKLSDQIFLNSSDNTLI